MIGDIHESQTGESMLAERMIILRNLNDLKVLKEELKSFNESLRSILSNDETLAEIEDKVSLIMQKVKERKAQLLVHPEVAQIKANIAERKERKKEIEDSLTSHVVSYTRLAGTDFIEDEAGNELKIKHKINISSGQQKLF